jgi:hypothetical protein
MAKVVYRPRIDLWRIVDGRNNKPLRANHNRAVDDGGCRTEIDAYRLLKAHETLPPTRKQKKEAKHKAEQRLEKIARSVERQVEKREGPGIAKAKP